MFFANTKTLALSSLLKKEDLIKLPRDLKIIQSNQLLHLEMNDTSINHVANNHFLYRLKPRGWF